MTYEFENLSYSQYKKYLAWAFVLPINGFFFFCIHFHERVCNILSRSHCDSLAEIWWTWTPVFFAAKSHSQLWDDRNWLQVFMHTFRNNWSFFFLSTSKCAAKSLRRWRYQYNKYNIQRFWFKVWQKKSQIILYIPEEILLRINLTQSLASY